MKLPKCQQIKRRNKGKKEEDRWKEEQIQLMLEGKIAIQMDKIQ